MCSKLPSDDIALRLKALELAGSLLPTAANISRVADQTSELAASWAFTQIELKKQAQAKFADAGKMLFVREALEQSTHERISQYHASLFPSGCLVADLTTGIGGDLIAIVRRGPAVGYEIDHERAACARHNLEALSLDCQIVEKDSLESEWTFEYAFADPARRKEGRRTLDPADFQPDPLELARRMSRLRLGLMKLSPMLPDQFLELLGGGLSFVSFGRECREVLVSFGSESKLDRGAYHVESGSWVLASEPVDGRVQGVPSNYLFEVDPAAIRAHALGTLCKELCLERLGDSGGYLTGDRQVESPWVRTYRVLDSLPFDRKQVRAKLKSQNLRLEAVKVRGMRLEADQVIKELKSDGSRRVILAVYPSESRIRACILEEDQKI